MCVIFTDDGCISLYILSIYFNSIVGSAVLVDTLNCGPGLLHFSETSFFGKFLSVSFVTLQQICNITGCHTNKLIY